MQLFIYAAGHATIATTIIIKAEYIQVQNRHRTLTLANSNVSVKVMYVSMANIWRNSSTLHFLSFVNTHNRLAYLALGLHLNKCKLTKHV